MTGGRDILINRANAFTFGVVVLLLLLRSVVVVVVVVDSGKRSAFIRCLVVLTAVVDHLVIFSSALSRRMLVFEPPMVF